VRVVKDFDSDGKNSERQAASIARITKAIHDHGIAGFMDAMDREFEIAAANISEEDEDEA